LLQMEVMYDRRAIKKLTQIHGGKPEGRIAKISEVVVHLPAEVWGPGKDTVPSIQPMGCLFEQSLLILHDLMVLVLMEKMGITASRMAKRHRNVE